MGLFQKKPDVSSSLPLYRISSENSFLIVGLGNPGKDYEMSRHNAGFVALDKFASQNDFSNWQLQKKHLAKTAMARLHGNLVILAKPQTFMNESGASVRQLQSYYKITNARTLVVYDELALPFGQLRARLGGADAGHNGVKSLIEHIGDDFGRLRIGIKSQRPVGDASKFVLQKFSSREQAKLPEIMQETSAMIGEFIYGGQLPHDTRMVT